jgi:hypothetical protein
LRHGAGRHRRAADGIRGVDLDQLLEDVMRHVAGGLLALGSTGPRGLRGEGCQNEDRRQQAMTVIQHKLRSAFKKAECNQSGVPSTEQGLHRL